MQGDSCIGGLTAGSTPGFFVLSLHLRRLPPPLGYWGSMDPNAELGIRVLGLNRYAVFR